MTEVQSPVWADLFLEPWRWVGTVPEWPWRWVGTGTAASVSDTARLVSGPRMTPGVRRWTEVAAGTVECLAASGTSVARAYC